MDGKKKMTHGEQYYHRRCNIDFREDTDKICQMLGSKLVQKMTRHKALEYYGAKFRKYFGTDEVTLRDFCGNVDDYFGYFEAKRILKALS
jgi:hypothetical protein